jgi:hypothetical protein
MSNFDGPQVYNSPGLEVVLPKATPNYSDKQPIVPEATFTSEYMPSNGGRKEDGGTLCGLKRPIFFLAVSLVCIIIVGAAIGGGVGGALARKSSESIQRYKS